MDLKRLKKAYDSLDLLDDRLAYKLRPGRSSLSRATPEQLEERLKHLSEFTLELKDLLREVILAAASRPKAPGGGDGPAKA